MELTLLADSLRRDIRYALRTVRHHTVFAVAAVLTLSIGIGANTAIFGVVNGVLIKPLPYPESDRFVAVWHTAPGLGMKDLNCSSTMYFTYREENKTFENLGLWSTGAASVTGIAEPEQVRALFVTYGTLETNGRP